MARRDRDPAQLGLFEAPPSAPPAPDAAAPGGAATAPAAPEPAPASSIREPDQPALTDGPLPDGAARTRIREDLETNLLVEAGAGSGKTTALVERMVALVRTGAAAATEVAAVTFTRKAAAELRQRFQTALESAVRHASAGGRPDEAERLDRALREIDRTFIGTIHSFCARLLREHPIEAGLDPAFRELLGPEEVRLRRGFWRAHLERVAAEDDPLVAELTEVGLAPSRLQGLFDELVANPDVEFPAEPVDPPGDEEVDTVRRRLDRMLDRGAALMPRDPPEKGWDELQVRIRLLLFLRGVIDWEDRTAFLDLLGEEVVGRSHKATQNRWPDGGAAKALAEEWGALRDGAASEVADRWWAHRYPIALRFAGRAAEAFEKERRRSGRLNFQDLLMLAARLLREHPAAREELGSRYRRLLVDEFQDTDPVQAEVLLLLSSPADGRPWQEAEPRPGALFVVGDPKQSIYRFRRADIAVYNLVRDRFRAVGGVVELVSNFRSLPPVGDLVNDVFGREGRFPDQATPYQAAFAPLATRREPDADRSLIAQYYVDPDGRSYAAAATDGAARLAPWVAREIAEGRRRPEDFLILARQKAELATYARALEAWRVPVQVTGAGVDQADELQELIVLLDALADPTDPVRVVAVLVGLLFGLDHDQLLAWVLGEDRTDAPDNAWPRSFDLTRVDDDDDTPVGRALRRLHGWWRLSHSLPADVLVGRIVDEVGLVPLAAARDLGELRAGSVLFALDAIRVAALQGDTSVAAATDALRTALEADEAEAPLEPVRRGVARIMTLHQAKGLEAPVVVLVHPVGGREHMVTRHIDRGADGRAIGYLAVQEKERYRLRTIARPLGWAGKEAEERRFEAAEQDRLLYVAATRAGERLVVARKAGQEQKAPWAGLYPWIDRHGRLLQLEPAIPPEPETLELDPEAMRRAVDDLAGERLRRATPGYLLRTVTGLAKAAPAESRVKDADTGLDANGAAPTAPLDPKDGPDAVFRGVSWGSAVHGALDAAARGASGGRLRAVCRAQLLEAERPTADGEPTELDELVSLVEAVTASPLWQRALRAERMLSEATFSFHAPAGVLPDPDAAAPAGAPRVLEGVVDLAFREPDGWVLVDYKTDVGTDAGFPARRAAYVRQVDLYARAWEAITGEPVAERVLFFTSREGGLETW